MRIFIYGTLGFLTSLFSSILVCISFTSKGFGIFDGILLIIFAILFWLVYWNDPRMESMKFKCMGLLFTLFNIGAAISMFYVSPDWQLNHKYFSRFLVNELPLIGFYVIFALFLWPLSSSVEDFFKIFGLSFDNELVAFTIFNIIFAIINGLIISYSDKDDTKGKLASRSIKNSIICWFLEGFTAIFFPYIMNGTCSFWCEICLCQKSEIQEI